MPEEKTDVARSRDRAPRMAPAERQRQLARCAVQVFARFGLGNAGHAQIAKEAGVSTPTVFLYLPNREALIDCVLTEVDQYLVDMVDSAAASVDGPAEKLLAVMHAFANAIDSDPDYVNVFLNWSTVVFDETWPQYVNFQDRILGKFETIIVHGIRTGTIPNSVNPASGAHLVMGSAHMIAQMKFRGRAQSEIDSFLAALLHGALSA